MSNQQGLSDIAIVGVLQRKIKDWMSSIEDEALRELVRPHVIVAGGSIASMLMGTKVNDFDVYIDDQDVAYALAKYYVARFVKNPATGTRGITSIGVRKRGEGTGVEVRVQSAGVAGETDKGDSGYAYFEGQGAQGNVAQQQFLDSQTPGAASFEASLAAQLYDTDVQAGPASTSAPESMAALAEQFVKDMEPDKQVGRGAANKYRPLFLSSNAITLSEDVQLILRFTGPGDEIVKNFDFVHTTCYWKSSCRGTDGLVLNQEALRSMQSMKLKYVGSRYPLCALVRTRKFVARGWTAPASVFIRAMWQCNQLDWNNIEVWKDQLTGMDTAYFNHIIDILKHDIAGGIKVDGAYVVAMIDKMM